MKIVALLPLKGHSERVPNKNIRDFCGKPLFHWVLESLLNSQYIDYVVINTDSELIANNAVSHFSKVKIINRPEHILGDHTPMNHIIDYDLSQTPGEHFLQTHSTNPLLKTTTINHAIEAYFEGLEKYDSLFSVTRWQTRLYLQDGSPLNHDPGVLLRTQDLDPIYEENSNLYIFSRTSFGNNNNTRIGLRPQMYEIEKLEAVDIDEESDFKIAEMLCELGKVKVETASR